METESWVQHTPLSVFSKNFWIVAMATDKLNPMLY